jgi:hypothetical protein
LAAIGALGLDTFIIREIIQEPNKRDEILGTSLWMRIAANALLIPIAIFITLFTIIFGRLKVNP